MTKGFHGETTRILEAHPVLLRCCCPDQFFILERRKFCGQDNFSKKCPARHLEKRKKKRRNNETRYWCAGRYCKQMERQLIPVRSCTRSRISTNEARVQRCIRTCILCCAATLLEQKSARTSGAGWVPLGRNDTQTEIQEGATRMPVTINNREIQQGTGTYSTTFSPSDSTTRYYGIPGTWYSSRFICFLCEHGSGDLVSFVSTEVVILFPSRARKLW